ncbi:Flp pilus assembly protein CpaB [Massilia sp. UMI-21]|nr:Flp pilus assembly protein CpaB [Massilia sp. UMI-21]
MKLDIFSKFRQFRPTRTWVVLGVAIGIGTVAAFAARSYLASQIDEIEARAKGKTVAVVVAKVDIPKGEKLSSATAAVRHIPIEFAHSGAITPDQFDRVEGQVIAHPLRSGEMILWGLMESQKAPTFSARVGPGRRAITVAVDEINSISGMLEPGDTIDLIATVDRGGRPATFPLLQSVMVMATGQRSVDDATTGDRRHFSTVTLDTTPQQAQNLIVAREVGKLTALLRNPQDKQVIGKLREDLFSAAASEPIDRSRARRSVPVIYGGNLSKLGPDALRLPLTAVNPPDFVGPHATPPIASLSSQMHEQR